MPSTSGPSPHVNGDTRQMTASVRKNLPNLVVFSHLRWEFVTQRPQHIIGRLAKDRKVLFIEEPIGFGPEEEGQARTIQVTDNLLVIQPRVHPDRLIEHLATLVDQYLPRQEGQGPVLWFYSPAFQEVTAHLPHSMVVFDCMDELSAFKGAPPSLIEQERHLINKADVVFTGGKSLYEAKSQLHKNVYCYPSSVDRAHFEQALHPEVKVPADLAALPHPVIGYYGVVDERIDYALLEEVARTNPDMSFVMIGPVVKVEEADLPRVENLHFMGGRQYNELPAYLKGFDIAMMPFALNESTRFISPTKTLEYIAAQKPVVSTPITDVVRDYSHVIPIARTAGEFSAALRTFRQENAAARERRRHEYEQILQAVSWDKTVAAMQENMDQNFRLMEMQKDQNLQNLQN
jgi:glycosyltransferase involved in cell wall biosynthesis